jgi:tRNA threonylcarbamoyladenosine biosynthesis protein TsaB
MSRRILALDTAGPVGSLALLEDGNLIEEIDLRAPDGLGEILLGRLETLLDHAGWPIGSIDLFAAGHGPGTFTGVRVGLTSIKGLASACGKPVCGVSNLQAVASFGSGPIRAAAIDARRGDVYSGLYNDRLELLEPEVVMPMDEWRKLESVEPLLHDHEHLLAAAIGRIAHQIGRPIEPALLDANYVRRADAEKSWTDSR